VRLSEERIKELQTLLKEEFNLDYTDEQAQEAGMAMIRFLIAKAQRRQELASSQENEDGRRMGNFRTASR